LRLVYLLAEQLHGTLRFEQREGTSVTLTFGDFATRVSG
jgi:two-component sensor histidine kinase